MSEKLYRIKPLEWTVTKSVGGVRYWIAETILGNATVTTSQKHGYLDFMGEVFEPFANADSAMHAAEDCYLERIKTALAPSPAGGEKP